MQCCSFGTRYRFGRPLLLSLDREDAGKLPPEEPQEVRLPHGPIGQLQTVIPSLPSKRIRLRGKVRRRRRAKRFRVDSLFSHTKHPLLRGA